MKLPHANNKTLVQGMGESRDIAISNRNAELISSFFRDKIYSDKEAAVVREYTANAIDEHRKHNVKRPIEISLDDKEWSVRDFGLGLDEDSIFNIFFTYLESTKSHNNDSMGGFGIGSKSGHAYSDRFFVTSYYGGEEATYLGILLSEEGKNKGKAYEVSRKPSAEPTGIKVSIPLKSPQAQQTFDRKTRFYVQWAQIPIKVNGKILEKEPAKFEGTNWSYGMASGHSYENILVVGDIAYTCKCGLPSTGFVFYAPIDAIDLALNKETPEYTDKTKTAIKKLEATVLKELKEQIAAKMVDLNFWESQALVRAIPYGIQTSLKAGRSIDIPMFYQIYNAAAARQTTSKKPRTITKDTLVYHTTEERLPRNFWKAFEYSEGKICIQYWESEDEKEKEFKDPEKFWKVAPKHQKLNVSDVEIPAIVRTRSDYVARPKWRSFGKLTTKRIVRDFVGVTKIIYEPNISKEEADKIFTDGGYYYAIPRGSEEVFDFNQRFSSEVNAYYSIPYITQGHVVGCVKASLKQFEKAPQWKCLQEHIKKSLTPELIKKQKRATWAALVSTHYVSFGDYRRKVSTHLCSFLSESLRLKIDKWKSETYLKLQADEVFTRPLVKLEQNTHKKLLTKAPDQLYSYVGAALMKSKCVPEKLKTLQQKIK